MSWNGRRLNVVQLVKCFLADQLYCLVVLQKLLQMLHTTHEDMAFSIYFHSDMQQIRF